MDVQIYTKESNDNSYKCISIYNFCYINENFENICKETQEEEYKFKFDDTKQYLKFCKDSEIYTTSTSKSFLYNKICYLNCPANTEINNEECKSKSLEIIYPDEYYNNKEN